MGNPLSKGYVNYMRVKWQIPFHSLYTFKQIFYATESEQSVDFMHNMGTYNYGVLSDLDASAVELKFLDSDLALLIILPNSKTGLTALELKLKDYDLSKVTDQLKETAIKIAVPKFSIGHIPNLKDVLIKMGTIEVISKNADLSGLLESGEPIAVFDKFFGFNVAGEMPEFYADHPFAYYIWDRKTKTTILSGRIKTLQ